MSGETYIGGMNKHIFFGVVWMGVSLFQACAGTSQSQNPMGDSVPCADCRSDSPVQWALSEESYYREWGGAGMPDSGTVIGVLPSLRLEVPDPGECSICHSFSEYSVDFDFDQAEDSLLKRAYPQSVLLKLFPGLDVPEADSSWFRAGLDSLGQQVFADGLALVDPEPWRQRAGEVTFSRSVSGGVQRWMARVAGRYGASFLAVPAFLHVELKPKLGKRGGFRWQSVWLLWNVRQGGVVLLDYQSFVAVSSGGGVPDRLWSGVWAGRLAEGLKRGARSEEWR